MLFLKKKSLLIIIVATFLLIIRIWFALTHVTFSQDQARDLFIVESFIENNQFFIGYGPKTSVGGFFVFPLYYQLMLFIHVIFKHPISMNLFITVLESLTPIVLYKLLRIFFCKSSSLIGSAIYSFSFLVVLFSTSAWSPNLTPLTSMLTLYFSMNYLVNNHKRSLFWIAISALLGAHFHFQFMALVPLLTMVLLVSIAREKSNLKYWIRGIIVASISYFPYLFFEFNNNWMNTIAIINFFFVEHTQIYERVSKAEYLLSFFPSFFERFLFGYNLPNFVIGYLIYYFGAISLFEKGLRNKDLKWLLICMGLLVISLRLFKGDKLDYYLMFMFFMPILFITSIVDHLNKFKLIVILPLFFILGYQLNITSFNDFHYLLNTFFKVESNQKIQDVHLIVHNLDKANSYIYFFEKSKKISLNRNSSIILEICDDYHQCQETNNKQCFINPVATFASSIKDANNIISEPITKDDKISIWIAESSSQKIIPDIVSTIEERADLINNEIN